jgi:PAS domain S-box-containing protein
MLIGMFMESQDQRMRSENLLTASEKKYRDLVTNLHEGVWLIDKSERTTYVNPSMAEMLGYTPEEMLGRPVYDFIDSKDNEETSQRISLRRIGVRDQYERGFIKKDGSILHSLISVAPVLNEQGEYLGSLAGVQDISRRVEAEKKLAEQSQGLEEMVRMRTRELESAQVRLMRTEKLATLGELAGSVGHELRNPLSVISNAVYLLRSSLPERNDKTDGYLRMIESEVKSASLIITDLLDYASARISPQEAVNLAAMVEEMLEDMEIPAVIMVEKKISNQLPHAYANPGHVRQILSNLLTNACQAMPDGGTLMVSAARHRGRIRFVVADTGVGISKVNMNRLFEPLFTTKPKGIGLGLALSKTLAEMNDMTIEADSQEGKGARFTLTFPIDDGIKP